VKTFVKHAALFLFLASGCYFFVLMLVLTVPYLNGEYDQGFLLTKQPILHLTSWRYAFYLHISSSLPVLIIGFLQVPSQLIGSFPRLHKCLGKIYVALVLFVSAPAGFIMALNANGGWPTQISFTLISLLWWGSTYYAYRLIRERKIEKHAQFMLRSFALTLSAITLRSYVLIFPHVFHLRGDHLYILVSWLSWVPNLIIAELIIRNNTAYKKLAEQL
jgi:uncharacterized membrane protein